MCSLIQTSRVTWSEIQNSITGETLRVPFSNEELKPLLQASIHTGLAIAELGRHGAPELSNYPIPEDCMLMDRREAITAAKALHEKLSESLRAPRIPEKEREHFENITTLLKQFLDLTSKR